jgi:D-threo-aldose 1-dehydrogenase
MMTFRESNVIPRIRLSRSGIATSRLGFGTSRLHYLSTRSERQRLLAAAFDMGFAHFDTAPSYGDGVGEMELATLLSKRRNQIVLATKFGIPPNKLISAPVLGSAMRALRSVSRRAGLWPDPWLLFTPEGIRRSLEQSLRRLSTDYVDILFLHEPSLPRFQTLESVLHELVTLQKSGLVRAFGLAGSFEPVCAILEVEASLGGVIQTSEREWGLPAHVPDITYGSIASGPQSFLSGYRGECDAPARLRQALARRDNGVVLVSSTKVDHLRQLAACAG